METVQLDELERSVSEYIGLAMAGETLSVIEEDREILQIVPVSQKPKGLRPIGLYKGQIFIADDFDAPLPDDVLADFEGRS